MRDAQPCQLPAYNSMLICFIPLKVRIGISSFSKFVLASPTMGPCISKDADAIGTTPNKQGVTQNESQETALKNQGINHYYKGEFKPALQCFSKALEIQELDAPNSLTVATSYNNIGSVLKGQGDLEGGLKEYGKALEIQEREALNSLTVATSCNNIRAVLKELDQGDLEGAMKEYYRACV